ncbi:MAG TPA: hypothetical protein VF690_03685 [Hymenobacter sp.]|jgi:curved DNA-binding protein CbpA
MSAIIFQQFLAQLDARDSAKAQGFDLNWYDQMSPDELKKAEKLLLKQARTGDMSPIQSLAKIATPDAIAFLEQTFEKKDYYPESGLNYELAKYLWDNTHDDKYLNVFDQLNLKSDTKRLRLIKWLSELPDKNKRINQLFEFLNDNYDVVRFQSAKEILRLIGLVKPDSSNMEDFRLLLNELASDDSKERLKGQKELKSLIKLHHKTS